MSIYTSKNGWSYEKKNETINDRLSEDVEKTINLWKKDGYFKFEGDYKDLMKKFIKYTTNDGKARNGGVVVKINDDYIVLKNINLNRNWSVQLENIKEIYIKDDKIKEIKELCSDYLRNKVLDRIYKENNNKIGRLKLYNILKNQGYSGISHYYISQWLKNKKNTIENKK
jgi:hypothetical protein